MNQVGYGNTYAIMNLVRLISLFFSRYR